MHRGATVAHLETAVVTVAGSSSDGVNGGLFVAKLATPPRIAAPVTFGVDRLGDGVGMPLHSQKTLL